MNIKILKIITLNTFLITGSLLISGQANAYCPAGEAADCGVEIIQKCNIKKMKPGDTCPDGSIFVGSAPDETAPLFTTGPAYQTSSKWGYYSEIIGALSNYRGVDNTKKIVDYKSDTKNPVSRDEGAAHYCFDLVAHGHDDWYLPSEMELAPVYENRFKIDGINTSGKFPYGLYWTSSEDSLISAYSKEFNRGFRINLAKNNEVMVRCIRSE